MPRSDATTPAPDWRGWLALAWVVWFGLLYGKMVVETRGGKIRAAVWGAPARAGEGQPRVARGGSPGVPYPAPAPASRR